MSRCDATPVTPATPPGGAPVGVPERAAALLTPPATTHPGWVRSVAAGGMPLGHTPQRLDRERERERERMTRRGWARHAERQEEES